MRKYILLAVIMFIALGCSAQIEQKNIEIYTVSDILFVYPCEDSWIVKSEILGFLIEKPSLFEAMKVVELLSPVEMDEDTPIREGRNFLKNAYEALLDIDFSGKTVIPFEKIEGI